MPNYKVVNADQLDADLATVANAIRARAGVSGKLSFPDAMAETARNIPTGTELPTLENPGVASDLKKGKQLIDANGGVIIGDHVCETVPEVEQATPTITVSANGLITASATQSAGKVSEGTKSATKQLTTQAAQTITPGTSDKTITSGKYLTGTQTIKGEPNLTAGNIKKGVSIFGIPGNCEEGVTLPNLENPGSASDLAEGVELIGADGKKVVGEIPVGYPSTSTGAAKWSSSTVGGVAINLVGIEAECNGDVIVRNGQAISLYASASEFGDAEPSDVRAGKTFTSLRGLKEKGTAEFEDSGAGGPASGDIVKAWPVSNLSIGSGYSSNISVSYGTEVTNSNGTLSLGGTTGSQSITSAADCEVLKGKYINKTSSGTTGIYYIPEDATFTYSGSTYSKSCTVDKANQMFVLA